MAKFTQNVDAGNPPSGLSYGGGITTNRLQGDQSGFYEGLAKEAEGRATGRVLEGVGNAIATLATSLDNAVQQDLFNSAEQEINQVRDMFGVSDATLLAQEGAPPQDLAQATNNIKRIQTAYESGALKASDYYARLNAVTKQLKTQYRGYERHVDNVVGSITGVNPANALVSSLRQEAEAAASEAEAGAKEWRNYESQNEKYILGIWTNYYELPEDQRPSQDQVRQAVGAQKAAELKVDNYSQFLQIKANEGTLSDDMLSKGANQVAAEFMQQSMTAGINGIAPVYSKVVEVLDKAQKEGVAPSPEEAEQIRAQLAQARVVTQATLNQKLSQGPYAMMDATERKNIIAQQMELYDTMQEALNNNDIGVLKSIARHNEATFQEDLKSLLTNDVLRKYYSFTKAFPPELSTFWLANPELGGANAVMGALVDWFTMRSTVGDGDISTDLDAIKEKDAFDPKVTKMTVDKLLMNLEASVSTNSPAAGAALNIVKYLYKDPLGFTKMFEDNSSADVFSQLFNNETVAAVKAATENDPGIWTDFVKKARQTFTSQSRELLSRIGNYNEKTRSLIIITINPKTGLLEAKPNEANLKIDPNDPYFVTRSELNELSVKHMLNDAKKINQYLAGLKAVFDQQENSVEEYNLYLRSIFEIHGIKLDTPTEEKEGEKDTSKIDLLNAPTLVSFTNENPEVGGLLNFIQGLEAPGGFNQVYGGGYADLANMTVNEVLDFQKSRTDKGVASSAAGGFQFLRKTLAGLKDDLGLTGEEFFTEELQVQLGQELLKRRGLEKYLNGEITKEQFADNLAHEWAALPLANGESAYKGIAGNKALTSRESLIAAIDQMSQPGSQYYELQSTRVSPDNVYGNMPKNEIEHFKQWNSDPIANHQAELASVDPRLQGVINKAQEIAQAEGLNFVIGSGKRDEKKQATAIKLGWSKTTKSRHLHGNATDIWVLDNKGRITFDSGKYKRLNEIIQKVAEAEGVQVTWGGTWKNADIPHWELNTQVAEK